MVNLCNVNFQHFQFPLVVLFYSRFCTIQLPNIFFFFFLQTFRFTNLSQLTFLFLLSLWNCKVFLRIFLIMSALSKLGISMFIFNRISFISLLMQPSVPLCSGFTKVFSFCGLTSRSLSLFFSLLTFSQKKGETYRQDSVRDEWSRAHCFTCMSHFSEEHHEEHHNIHRRLWGEW